jgi:hypothetical protein
MYAVSFYSIHAGQIIQPLTATVVNERKKIITEITTHTSV